MPRHVERARGTSSWQATVPTHYQDSARVVRAPQSAISGTAARCGPALEGDQFSGVCPTILLLRPPGRSRSGAGLNDGRDGARRDPERRRQVIDRDHQDVVLTPLYSTSSNEAQYRQRAAATPPSPAARQPHRLLVRQGEMAPLVGPGR
jgi:hypothetical protein